MPGFHEGLNIEADTVGQALTALLNERALLIVGQEWADPKETARVFDEIGRIIDAHFETTNGSITLPFKEAHRSTNPILSLGDLDFSLAYDRLYGLFTSRIVILEVDRLGVTTDNGVYEVRIYSTALYVGTLPVWTKRQT